MNDWNNKEFRKEYDRQRFQSNKAKRIAQNKARQEFLKAKVDEYKAANGCSRCSENTPVCLDFHHLDSDEKEIEISNAVRCGWKLERILKEISKCILLCANCHRKEHSNR